MHYSAQYGETVRRRWLEAHARPATSRDVTGGRIVNKVKKTKRQRAVISALSLRINSYTMRVGKVAPKDELNDNRNS